MNEEPEQNCWEEADLNRIVDIAGTAAVSAQNFEHIAILLIGKAGSRMAWGCKFGEDPLTLVGHLEKVKLQILDMDQAVEDMLNELDEENENDGDDLILGEEDDD